MSLKICAGASAGGHMNQLLRLLENAGEWETRPAVYVTTVPEVAVELKKRGKTYMIGECNRKTPVAAIAIIIRSFKIIWKEKPDVIITTGSMPLAMLSIVAKVCGKKVVWIDSIANSERFSVSGRLMCRCADLFLVQWPRLAERHSKAQYAGAII